MIGKLKSYAWVLALGLGLAFAWQWNANRTESAELAVLKAENAKRFEQLEAKLTAVAEDNAQKERQIEALLSANAQLSAVNTRLLGDMARERQERDRRVSEVSGLSLSAVAVQTLSELNLEPPAVRTTADDYLVFTPEAGKANLEHLIIGASARRELGISNQRIANLEVQLENDAKIIEQQKEIIANKDAEIAVIQEKADLKIAELEKEIQVTKAEARKRNILAVILGLVGGLILGR